MIGEFKNRITFERYGAPTQSATGGLIQGSLAALWVKWSKVEDRSGSLSTDKGREWNYDYKVTVRYQPSKVEQSGDLVIYGGNRMVIRSVEFKGEGRKRLVIIRCSRHE